ncbi:MAG TPA: hypothetical protein VKA54_17925 [Gemmatimonadaceae bacterium]|nr:hypothetical protein [Gemmatimonadaceae bacterium]
MRSRCPGVLHVSLFSSCTLWNHAAAPPRWLHDLGASARAFGTASGIEHSRARLILRDGSPPLALSDVTVWSDSVTGYLIDQGSSRMAFPRADVVAVETRVPNHFGNIGIILVGIAAVLVGSYFVVMGQDKS